MAKSRLLERFWDIIARKKAVLGSNGSGNGEKKTAWWSKVVDNGCYVA